MMSDINLKVAVVEIFVVNSRLLAPTDGRRSDHTLPDAHVENEPKF